MGEIADYVREFPSSEVAHTLSPKRLLSLDQYDWVAHGPAFRETPNDGSHGSRKVVSPPRSRWILTVWLHSLPDAQSSQ